MGIFSIKELDDQTSLALISDALVLTSYSYHGLYDGFYSGYESYGLSSWSGWASTLISAVFGNTESQGIISGLPWTPDGEVAAQQSLSQAGWAVISAEELGYTGKTNSLGTFYGETAGYSTAQVEILGKYDEQGNLVKIGIAFRGTSGPREEIITDTLGDLVNDVMAAIGPDDYSDNYTLNAFGTLLEDVKNFALQQGLGGEDILVSGHSLGGLATNSMAALSDEEWDGFYAQSTYIAFASPTQYEEGDKVLNLGFENDPVFRALDGTDLSWSSLGVHDSEHFSTTDNIVNFNDYYISNASTILPFSILNLATWVSHLPSFYQDSFVRIMNSSFYHLTEQDSTIIVSNLSDTTRENTWVSDLNRDAEQHTGPTFIIGTDKNDLIQGGEGNDYLEGLGGDDIFRDSGGYNIIVGGEGINTLDLQHSLAESEIAFDGETLYLRDGDGGITLASDISSVVSHESFLWFFGYDEEHQVTAEGLLAGNKLTAWSSSVNGDSADNILTSMTEKSWLFGGAGNDTLESHYNHTTFVGGSGDDILISDAKFNTYLFSGDFGNDVIACLDASDKVVFLGVEGMMQGDYHTYLTTSGNDLVLAYGENSVTFSNIDLQTLEAASLTFV